MLGGFQVGPFQLAYQQIAPASGPSPSGGWEPRYGFLYEYEREMARRSRARKKRKDDEEEALKVEDQISREIAQLLHEQERKDAERADLQRLKNLVTQYRQIAQAQVSPRVAEAMARAIAQENFSALQALDRELERMFDEEAMAVLMILLNED